MDQSERRLFLIRALLDEQPGYKGTSIPQNTFEQKQLLRGLMNIRMPGEIGEDFLKIQDEYLKEELNRKGIVDSSTFSPVKPDIYLWQGDITTLRCDAIVNAANSGMTGCYLPGHNCIDNGIHTYAGVQLRNYCAELMKRQGHEEPTGQAKITPAFNLPSKYVIHTVGPIFSGKLTQKQCDQLASCYKSCLIIADENGCESIAFCCISTGVFGFPQAEAARIAVSTVNDYKSKTASGIKIIFNVFKDEDLEIYSKILA